jgi:hypothetical protein
MEVAFDEFDGEATGLIASKLAPTERSPVIRDL